MVLMDSELVEFPQNPWKMLFKRQGHPLGSAFFLGSRTTTLSTRSSGRQLSRSKWDSVLIHWVHSVTTELSSTKENAWDKIIIQLHSKLIIASSISFQRCRAEQCLLFCSNSDNKWFNSSLVKTLLVEDYFSTVNWDLIFLATAQRGDISKYE